TRRGNQFIVTIAATFSKYFECAATAEVTTATIAEVVLELIICRHGVPEIMISDQGKQFISAIASVLYKSLGIRRITTTPYHPQANMVERYNKTLKQVLKLWVNETHSDWDVLMPYVRFAYNTEYHSVSKETPYYVIHARDPRSVIDILTSRPQQYSTSVHEYVNVI